jgi:YVTN family beta-propeller protein
MTLWRVFHRSPSLSFAQLCRAGSVVFDSPVAVVLVLAVWFAASINGEAQTFTSTIPVGNNPYTASVNLSTNKIYVANQGDHNVSVIDGATGAVIKTVPVQATPSAMAIDPTRNIVYVANSGGLNGSVTVIDGKNDTVSGTVNTGNSPQSIAVNPVTGMAYVANQISSDVSVLQGTRFIAQITGIPSVYVVTVNSVTNKIYAADHFDTNVVVIDGATNTIVKTIPGAGPNATSGAVNPVTNRIYFTNESANEVTVIDGNTDTVMTLAPTGSGPAAIAANPVTNKIYVSDSGDTTVTVIDGATNAVSQIAGGSGTGSYALALDTVTNRIYVANVNANNVTVIDASNGNSVQAVATGSGPPIAVAISATTNKIYICNYYSKTVSVVDGATYGTAPITLPSTPLLSAVDPSTNKVYIVTNGGQVVPVDGVTDGPAAPILSGGAVSDIAAIPYTHKLYVATGTSNQVTQIDEATGATVAIPVSQPYQRLKADPARNKIYAWSPGSSPSPSSIDVIDGASLTASTVTTPTSISDLSVNVATNKVYASSQTGPVYVLSGLANNVVTTIPISGASYNVAVNPATNRIYVTNAVGSTNGIVIIDGLTDTAQSTTISLTYRPASIALNPTANRLYVSDGSSVSTVDLATNTATDISASGGANSIAVNQLTNKTYLSQTSGFSVIDGITNNLATVTMGTNTSTFRSVVNPVTNKAYTNSNNNGLVRIAEANTQDVLLDTVIAADTTDPLIVPQPTNVLVTYNAKPNFLFTATSRFPNSIPPIAMFYQVDTWQGTWTQATLSASGSTTASFSGTPPAQLLPGEHVLYAYATDASPQTASTFDDADSIGNMTAFYFVVLNTTTATTVVSDVNPQNSGSSVTFTATVTPQQMIGTSGPTGTVSFYDGVTLLGTGTVNLVSGSYVATLATSSLTAGSHTITATYSGDTSYGESSGTMTQKITGPAASIVATSGGGQTTVYGTPFANPLVATVTDVNGTPVPGASVTFSGAGLNFSSATVATDTNGLAQVSVTQTGAGSFTASASVSGVSTPATFALTVTKATLTVTANNQQRAYGQANPSLTYGIAGFQNGDTSSVITGTPTLATTAVTNSPPGGYPITVSVTGMTAVNYIFAAANGTLTVAKASPVVVVSSSLNPSLYGNSVTFTATVPSDATGTMAFFDGTTALGTATISNGTAAMTTSTLATATHSITARYSGDSNYNAATSAVLSQLVNKLPGSVTENVSPNPAVSGSPVTITATVVTGETGSVTFYDGTTAIGTATIVNGVATLSVTGFTPGNHTITAIYSGDENHTSATSAAMTLIVTAVVADFSVRNNTAPQIIPPGASASYNISIASVSAPFTNPVNLTATNLPPGATYTYTPSTVTPGAAGATSSFTVSVPKQTAANHQRGSGWPMTLAVLLLPLALYRRARGRPPQLLVWLLLGFAVIGSAIGCGTGGYFSQPEQTYVITVTGTSGNLVRSTTATLTVE